MARGLLAAGELEGVSREGESLRHERRFPVWPARRHGPEVGTHLAVHAAGVVAVVGVAAREARVARRAAVVVVGDRTDPRVPSRAAHSHAVHPGDRLVSVADPRDVCRADDHPDHEVDRSRSVAGNGQDAIALAPQGVVEGAGVELEHADPTLPEAARTITGAGDRRTTPAVHRIRAAASPGELRVAVGHAGLGVGDAGEHPSLRHPVVCRCVPDLAGADATLRCRQQGFGRTDVPFEEWLASSVGETAGGGGDEEAGEGELDAHDVMICANREPWPHPGGCGQQSALLRT